MEHYSTEELCVELENRFLNSNGITFVNKEVLEFLFNQIAEELDFRERK